MPAGENISYIQGAVSQDQTSQGMVLRASETGGPFAPRYILSAEQAATVRTRLDALDPKFRAEVEKQPALMREYILYDLIFR